MVNVSIDQLADAIADAVKEYTEDVSEAIEKRVESVADEVLNDILSNAPRRNGQYVKGFKKTDASVQGRKRFVVWNKKHYMLVHLLEFGHAKRGGGRVQGKPHMRPAYERRAANLTGEIKDIIRNGGE